MSFTVSVVITTFNRPQELEEALDGVYAQISKPKEVIVVNDASSLPYDDIKAKFSRYENFQYYLLETSSGANKARNLGVERATGDIIAFLDDDDVWMPDYLLEHISAYEQGADAVVSGYQNLGKEDEVYVQDSPRVEASVLRTGNQYCGMSGFSMKRELALKERFDESLPNGQDWDMYVRLLQNGYNLVNIPKAVFYYRFQNMDGIGAKVAKMTPEQAIVRLRSADKHREFLGDEFYRRRVAAQLLVYLPLKRQKYKWLMASVQRAGLFITCQHLLAVTKKKWRAARLQRAGAARRKLA
ncbi:glycosyltransferase family 2 protein [Alteromonas sp. ASW11-19]|uniref:Glycosyltransferase family 2 protein n=1 Tax=Alteromonas salexigens TaxID=2982530 RepID=A0ABT2VSI5_9ALTE|nr:glycosyltransferase family A protein [Alteromonas salexigens]MCU7556110.1 glycosyltransferase family 2 protein [Alteromonas salexigens]